MLKKSIYSTRFGRDEYIGICHFPLGVIDTPRFMGKVQIVKGETLELNDKISIHPNSIKTQVFCGHLHFIALP